MSEIVESTIIKNIHSCRSIVRGLGIDIRVGHNLEEFRDIIFGQPLRHKLAPAFDPNHRYLRHINSLWMVGYGKSGELVATQAIKLIDLGGQQLSSYLEDHIWEIHPFGFDPEVTNTCSFLSPDARRISGKITYHGELWLKGGPGGVRGGSFSTLFTRLMLLEGLIRWSPDFLIGFQSPLNACKGLGVRESYLRMEQRSVVWQKRREQESLEGWLVWMTAQEAAFNLRVPPVCFLDWLETNGSAKEHIMSRVA